MTRNKLCRVAFCLFLTIMLVLPTAALVTAQEAAPASEVLSTDRTILPIPEPQYPHSTVLDVRNATPPPRFEVKAPTNAPNVLIVLIDDMGFGQSSAFGGPIKMPTVDRLADSGLRYNEFHTTALCSPTRTALLSGRNHHMNNMGSITETATAFPGQTGQRPESVAPLAMMLRYNGYSTLLSERITRPPHGKSALRGRPTAGRPEAALTSSTDSWAEKRTSGRRPSTTA